MRELEWDEQNSRKQRRLGRRLREEHGREKGGRATKRRTVGWGSSESSMGTERRENGTKQVKRDELRSRREALRAGEGPKDALAKLE